MTGLLKAFGVLAVLLLAGLGILFVLDLIPRETLQTLSTKGVLVIGILAAAGLVLGLLLRKDG
jgi:hypothetical protein